MLALEDRRDTEAISRRCELVTTPLVCTGFCGGLSECSGAAELFARTLRVCACVCVYV